MGSVLNIAVLIIAVILIALVLFQGGRNNTDNVLLGKRSLALYQVNKERGTDKAIVYATAAAGTLFIVLSIVINRLGGAA